MSRIAPLEPPYTPEIQAQFDRIMRGAPPLALFRVVAGPGTNSVPAACWTAGRCHCASVRSSSTAPAR